MQPCADCQASLGTGKEPHQVGEMRSARMPFQRTVPMLYWDKSQLLQGDRASRGRPGEELEPQDTEISFSLLCIPEAGPLLTTQQDKEPKSSNCQQKQ